MSLGITMLHVAIAGTLADSLDAFRQTPIRTSISYYNLQDESLNPAQIDLVIYLADDLSCSSEVERLTSASSLPLALASAWATVPTGPAIDTAVQQSLLRVYGFVVGYTEAMHRICRWLRLLTHPAGAARRLPVHVTGETGTGKELIANAIHRLSPLHGPFVPVNMAAIPVELATAVLFGHTPGAFTGAGQGHMGLIGQAQGGVLFLDEIGAAPLSIQAMLLRFLDSGEYRPLGADKIHKVRTQLVTATNADLPQLVRERQFRMDLFSRLSGVTISLPPLRERRDDIPLLIRSFFNDLGKPYIIDNEIEQLLCLKDWPRNIRQLKTYVDRFALFGLHTDAEAATHLSDLDSPSGTRVEDDSRTLEELRRDFDRRVITQRLRRFGGDTQATAKSLGISRRSVYDLARRLGVDIQSTDSD